MASRLLFAFYSPPMVRSRSLLALLGASIALVTSLGLAGCGPGSKTGPAGKVTDIASSDGLSFGGYAVASSAQGDVALAFETGGEIKLQELPASSGSWTKPFTVTPRETGESTGQPLGGDPALAYDDSGRLLVAWIASPDPQLGCDRWQIEAQLREANGHWQPKKLVARPPESQCPGALDYFQISSGERSFALSWPSGLLILDGDEWRAVNSVDTTYAPPSIEYLADDRALALWRKPGGTIISAPLTVSGRLGKEQTLADKAGDLTVASSPTRAIAAWTRGLRIWARIWSHGRWGETKRLVLSGDDSPLSHPIAVAITRDRAVVAWAQRGGWVDDWGSSQYVLEKQGRWSDPASLSLSPQSAGSAQAAALSSGEIVILGPDRLGDSAGLIHIPAFGKVERSRFDLLRSMEMSRRDAFTAGPRAVVLARQVNESPLEDGEDPHLLVWVYRP